MNRATRCTAVILATITLAVGTAWTAQPAWAGTYSAPLRTAVANLPVTVEVRVGYQRDLFPHWIDADSDRCNTRYEVLIVEARTAPRVGYPCTLTGGRWYSYYDNVYWTNPADLDIDHVVALAEAWDSGARAWGTTVRRAFANDLGDPRSLIAVTDRVNQSKGDQDPGTWLPSASGARCRYITDWVAVKTRWRLTVDTAEKKALVTQASSCTNVAITVTYAR